MTHHNDRQLNYYDKEPATGGNNFIVSKSLGTVDVYDDLTLSRCTMHRALRAMQSILGNTLSPLSQTLNLSGHIIIIPFLSFVFLFGFSVVFWLSFSSFSFFSPFFDAHSAP